MPEGSASRRAALAARISGGIKLNDEVRLLADLISLINQADNLEFAVEGLKHERLPADSLAAAKRAGRAWQKRLAKLQGTVRVAKVLTARMRRVQLARFIFLRRAHVGFVLHQLSRSCSVSYSQIAVDHRLLAERVVKRYQSDIELAVPLEMEYLRYRARNPGAEADDTEATDASLDSVDTLLPTAALNERDVFVDIIKLTDLAREFAKVLRQGRTNIMVLTSNLGHQPAAHAAKLVERLCRTWQTSTLPNLLHELVQLNLQASVLAAGAFETGEEFTGSWQREIWPNWIETVLELEWLKTKQFVEDVLALHELESGN